LAFYPKGWYTSLEERAINLQSRDLFKDKLEKTPVEELGERWRQTGGSRPCGSFQITFGLGSESRHISPDPLYGVVTIK
jgi:hypothetical protein